MDEQTIRGAIAEMATKLEGMALLQDVQRAAFAVVIASPETHEDLAAAARVGHELASSYLRLLDEALVKLRAIVGDNAAAGETLQ